MNFFDFFKEVIVLWALFRFPGPPYGAYRESSERLGSQSSVTSGLARLGHQWGLAGLGSAGLGFGLARVS